MPSPHVSTRLKDVPPRVLRAAFAGVGQVLLAADKLRAMARETAAQSARAAKAARTEAARAAQSARTEATRAAQARKTSTAPADKPGNKASTAPPDKPGSTEPAAKPVRAGQPAATTDALPVAGYDELPLASIRARLRVLDASQVKTLLDYEKMHQNRQPVVTMFERRLTKLAEPPA